MGEIIKLKAIVKICLLLTFISCRQSLKARRQFSQTGYCYTANTNLETKLHHDGFYSFHDSSYAYSGHPARMTLSNYRENYVFFDNHQLAIFSDNDKDYFVWGSYTIAGDTIKSLTFATPPNVTWGKKEIWFKILNRKELQQIGLVWERKMTHSDLESYQSMNSKKKSLSGHFIRSDNLPDPDKSWLKKRKWFWCDKKEYKRWKQDN
ncbi:hypothetical protein [Dyadobacter aurulentus]|uniref:hypothetical protein n=1 Tax=Dyadobacter sp. UC 10 TaxID=2605428 RepID=UPI0011F24B55|nr:hypothetical protein [Dyadobacter sp. UC 10]KAA0992688.1 hypothetical protein FXO21_22190 [Dyadobacter sp. UC 10]